MRNENYSLCGPSQLFGLWNKLLPSRQTIFPGKTRPRGLVREGLSWRQGALRAVWGPHSCHSGMVPKPQRLWKSWKARSGF